MTSTSASHSTLFRFSSLLEKASYVGRLRAVLTLILLLFILGLQSLHTHFVASEIVLPIYFFLFVSLFAHSIFILNHEKLESKKIIQWLMLFWDALVVSSLIYFTSMSHVFLILFYFVYIGLCGLVYGKRSALFLASWVSILYSSLLVVKPDADVYGFSIILNHFAFYCTALVSGDLSRQFHFLKSELSQKRIDLKVVRDLNEAIVHHIRAGILSLNSEGKILKCNQEAERVIGVVESQLLGESIEKLIPSPRNTFSGEIYKEKKFEAEVRNVSEKFYILNVSVSPMIEQGELVGYVVLLQDITEIRNLENKMRQSEKLAAVGQLAAGIAHEIRNPLASISGSVQMIASEGMTDAEDRQKLSKIIEKEIDRLNLLISEFLEFVKPEEMKKEQVNLSAMIKTIFEELKFNKNISSETKKTLEVDDDLFIHGNENKIKQAVLNIIINAFQATEKSEKPEIRVQLRSKEQRLKLSIRDNGVGMTEAQKQKIFEPFHTTKPKGTGLGLAITHKILQVHDVNVLVKSEKGIGTEFILNFPMIEH